MVRTIAGVLAGVLVGVLVVFVAESLGHLVFPPPEGVDLKDPQALKAIMHEIPVGAKISVLIAWGLGVFVGGASAKLIAHGSSVAVWWVAALLYAGAAITMIQIPHPSWMIVGSILVTLGGAFGALRLVGR